MRKYGSGRGNNFVESRGVIASGQKGGGERSRMAPVFFCIGCIQPYSWMTFDWCKWVCVTYFPGNCKSFYVSAGKCVLNDFDDTNTYEYSYSTNQKVNNAKVLPVPGAQYGQVKDC